MKNKGFTLVELVIVIFIITLLATISTVSYLYFERKTNLDKTANDILSVIKTAQNRTLASEGASQYGIHFETNQYILFKGSSYSVGSPDNTTYSLPQQVEIYNISLSGGGSDVIFQRISGATDQSGTIGLRLVSDVSKTRSITISSTGHAEIEPSGTPCCTTNRNIDTRHLNLTLGWSIQTYTTLTLTFPDTPTVNENITMADYFNPEQSVFSWSGSVDVNGESQELVIHTTFLDATNTILSIHRDQGKNTKPLQVYIDSRDIVSYTADGEITVNTYGGTPELQ